MTIKTDIIITMASWEERFLLGSEQLINQMRPNRMLMFYNCEHSDRTLANRTSVVDICRKTSVESMTAELTFEEPASSWRKIHNALESLQQNQVGIVLDISTMPRETIWSILYLLSVKKISPIFTYFRPRSYPGTWLSADFQRPRLVIKLGGIFKFGLPTTLIASAGYDVDRAYHVISAFEPRTSYLGLQSDHLDGRSQQNAQTYQERFATRPDVHLFEMDCYASDHGFSALEPYVRDEAQRANVILCSLGPKPSAISAFLLHQKYPHVALAYAPAREFNLEYSSGLGKLFSGTLDFSLSP